MTRAALTLAAFLAAASPATAAYETTTPKRIVTVPAGQTVEWVAPRESPGRMEQQSVLVWVGGQIGDTSDDPGSCHWREWWLPRGAGHAVVVWHDECGKRPRVRVWSARKIRVVVQGWFQYWPLFQPRPAPTPEPVGGDYVLVCDVVPADQAPVTTVLDRAAVHRAKAILAGPVTP